MWFIPARAQDRVGVGEARAVTLRTRLRSRGQNSQRAPIDASALPERRVSFPQSPYLRQPLSDLDIAKEKIAYLKVWLGILLVTDISTFGWLVSNVDAATTLLLWAAVIAVVALTSGILLLHRRIDRHIQSLKEL